MTKLALVVLIICKLTFSWAQGNASSLTPAEMNEFKNNLAEMEAKKAEEQRKLQAEQQAQKQKFVFPPSPNQAVPPAAPATPPEGSPSQDLTAQPPPLASPTPAVPDPANNPGQQVPAQPADPSAGNSSVPVVGSGDLRSAVIKQSGPIPISSDQRVKSPFMIPNELYIKIKKKMGEKPNLIVIDEAVEARLRWPLKEYKLVGVIYDTKKPKAMIADREGKVHVYREKELIANGGGYVAEINNGEVIIVEKGAEAKLQLKEK